MDDPLNLILDVTRERKKEKEAKTAPVRTLWIPAVNNHGGFGRWAFLEITDPYDDVAEMMRRAVRGCRSDISIDAKEGTEEIVRR